VIVWYLSGALNAADTQNLGNYALATVPRGEKKGKGIALSKATYDAAALTLRPVTRKKLVLNPSLRLTIHVAGLHDVQGQPLDGNHDGQPGGDLLATFSQSRVSIG
jgi:hypothetical protein